MLSKSGNARKNLAMLIFDQNRSVAVFMCSFMHPETVMTTATFVHMLAITIALMGALHAGLVGLFDLDVIAATMGYGIPAKIVYVAIMCAVIYALKRDIFLPFLSVSAYPCGSLLEKTPYMYDTEIGVTVKPRANVIYWAANSSNKGAMSNPIDAYSLHSNAGVARADSTGLALLRVRRPSAYRVPLFGRLDPHVHYRVCEGPGMLGPVKTVYV